MPVAHEYALVNPDEVIVNRDARQRKDVDVSDLLDSIRVHGVIHPIIVQRDMTLVSGERRLTACRKLECQVPIRFLDELTPNEASILELEENIRRADLPWKDFVRAVNSIHEIYIGNNATWTKADTARELNFHVRTIEKILAVYPELDSPKLANATGWKPASIILEKYNMRQQAALIADVLEASCDGELWAEPNIAAVAPAVDRQSTASVHVDRQLTASVHHADFLKWAPEYNGPRFNFLHCDFPYGINAFGGKQMQQSLEHYYDDGEEVYWNLLECLCENLDNILGPSAHVLFWFSMRYYTRTRRLLMDKAPSLVVVPHPLVWLKSDNSGVVAVPNREPRNIYETALLMCRGNRPLTKVISNAIAAPTDRKLHPSAKPLPVLEYFFSALVDDTTRMLDPTCGAGSALRAAETHGAEYIMGLDIHEPYVTIANDELRLSRAMRDK